MEKSKYEVAKEILDNFDIPYLAKQKFGSVGNGKTLDGENTYKLKNTEQAEEALEWYLKQLEKVLSVFNKS